MSANKTCKQPPWFSLRHAFHGFQQQRLPGSLKKKQFQRHDVEIESGHVTAYGLHVVDSSRSSEQTSAGNSGIINSSAQQLSLTSAQMECLLCTQTKPAESFFPLITCQHHSCTDCLKTYLRIEITEGRVGVACPECPQKLHPDDIRRIVNDESLVRKYEEFMLRHVLALDPDSRWCPAPDCGYAVIASGCASCPQLTCERVGCGMLFCYHCKQSWHPNQTCDTARAERSSNRMLIVPDGGKEQISPSMIKACPRCCSLIMKIDDGSCNHMTCVGCGSEFCWLCMKEITDLHYLSPSGCTFWGKKPWSRKRKVLWQLGMLIGAPVGIALIAGVAFPVIIIGLPILAGRKLLEKCRHMAKRKRHLVVASGVIASALVSPVLAAVAVGVGIPMLLAYVYGVVPISLCRDGCCAGHGRNQDFDFDMKPELGDNNGSPSLKSPGTLAGSSSDGETVSGAAALLHDANLIMSTNKTENLLTNSESVFPIRLKVEVEVAKDLPKQDKHVNLHSENVTLEDCCDQKSCTQTITVVEDISDRDLGKHSTACVSVSDVSLTSPGISSAPCSTSATIPAGFVLPSNSSSSDESVHPRVTSQRRMTKPFGNSSIISDSAALARSVKRQSMSVGDSIDERTETEFGYLSLHSLDEEAGLESFPGGSDIVTMVAASDKVHLQDTQTRLKTAQHTASAALSEDGSESHVTQMNEACHAVKSVAFNLNCSKSQSDFVTVQIPSEEIIHITCDKKRENRRY